MIIQLVRSAQVITQLDVAVINFKVSSIKIISKNWNLKGTYIFEIKFKKMTKKINFKGSRIKIIYLLNGTFTYSMISWNYENGKLGPFYSMFFKKLGVMYVLIVTVNT